MDGVGMDESNLKPEEAAPRLSVDQLRTRARKISERRADIVHAIRNVVHPRATLREERADRRVRAGRREQLDPATAYEHRRCFDALLVQLIAMLEPTAEQPRVRVYRLVEIDDSQSEVVDTARLHRARCYLWSHTRYAVTLMCGYRKDAVPDR